MKYTKTSNIYTRVQESGYGGAHRANNFLIFKYQTLKHPCTDVLSASGANNFLIFKYQTLSHVPL